VAVAEVSGPAAGLAAADELKLESYYLFHAVRADFLRRLRRTGPAADAYAAAITLAGNAAERDYLRGRLESLTGE
jgi:RNA polymerase sigma-70 factor (ECF subfamily)